jgi:choice-of-anchor B domain-containing protein
MKKMKSSKFAMVVASTVAFLATPWTMAQFQSQNVSLYAHIDLATFGAGSGNDCWGYVSPSGREYALMSVSNKLAFVEITDPRNPVYFANVPHPNSTWGDVKVYQQTCYCVTETGGTGIQVIDLSDIDNHNVTLVRTLSAPDTNHNIAIDTASGFLYTCGSRGGAGTTVYFDLTDPNNPVQAGVWTNAYHHDSQIITYTSGPYAGKQILFGASESRGVDIVDVTNKSNPILLSRTPYTNVSYCHQLWTEDLQYLYVDDELDGIPRTTVFEISDLANPIYAGDFTSGTQSIDHNLYILDGFIYEANYHSGLRIFDSNVDRVNPPQVGWFDTYPENDGDGFDGAWSNYPFFPSGTCIISDINRGLFIVDPSGALGGLLFTHPSGLPEQISPSGGNTVSLEVAGRGNITPEPGTGLFYYDIGGGFQQGQIAETSPNVYEATFPAAPCGTVVQYYFTADTTGGETLSDPPGGANAPYTALAAFGEIELFSDNFETDTGWTVENLGATSGDWERGVPVDDPGWEYDPASDSDGSGQCYLTDNALGNTDVDDGAVRLTSPLLDLTTAPGPTISYDYFLNLTNSNGADRLLVEVSANDNAGPWVQIALHATGGGLSWRTHEISAADLANAGVPLTANMRLRYTANDGNPQSIVEAGLDAFKIFVLDCEPPFAVGDLNCDGTIDAFDIEPFITALVDPNAYPGMYPNCDIDLADINGDGAIDGFDIEPFINLLLP